MSDRTIVRRITETRVIVRQGDTPAKVIVRNLGPKGDDGDPGDSAYAVAVANGFVGSEAAWLASLVGDDGPPGVVAAEAPLSYNSLTQTIETDDLVTALASKIPATEKGAANGVASLDGTGKVPTGQLPIAAALGSVTYQGTWNATSNTPTIPAAAVGNKGYYYRVATAGSTTIDGVSDWKVGDWIVSDGAIWQKVDNTDPAGVSDVPGLVTALGLKADQTALDSEETDRIAGDDALQAEIDALPNSGGGSVVHYGDGVPDPTLGVQSDSYVDRLTGNLYKKWSKPAAWAWNAAGSAQPDLAALAGLILAANEGSGSPKELVTNTALTRVGGCTWATQDGMPVLRFDGTGYMLIDPVIQSSTVYTYLIVVRSAAPVVPEPDSLDMGLYEEVLDGGTADGYIEPLFLSQNHNRGADAVEVGSDHYLTATDEELYSVLVNPPGSTIADENKYYPDLSGLTALIARRNGADLRMWHSGVERSGQPPSPDANVVVPTTKAVIGITTDDGTTYTRAGLVGDIAALVIWPTTALSDADIEGRLVPDPLGVARQAGADLTAEPGIWVLEAELATQAELGAEATTRGNADTALDTRVDALELAPPAHVHPESEVTNLVTDLGLKAPLDSPAFINVPTAPTAAPGTNTPQIATMAALQAAITALINGAPGALDTLLEISNQLATDESAVAALITTVAGKQASHANLTAFAALTLIANKLAYANGSGTLALTDYTAFARTWDALADAAAGRSALSLGALAVLATVGAAQIDADAVTTVKILDDNATNAKLANMATATMKGRKTAGTGDPEDLSASDARTNMGLGSLATVTPTGTPDGTKFLRDDSSWQAASGGGGLTSLEPALFYSGRLI